jgi:hypothetical protein
MAIEAANGDDQRRRLEFSSASRGTRCADSKHRVPQSMGGATAHFDNAYFSSIWSFSGTTDEPISSNRDRRMHGVRDVPKQHTKK